MSDDKRPEWMTSISATVDPEDYLLGRKIDKTFELSQKERADRARELRINLASSDRLKFIGDPMLDIERRRQEMKLELIRNPIKLKQLREKLLKEEREKQGLSASQNQSERKEQPSNAPSSSSTSTRDRVRERSHTSSRERLRSPPLSRSNADSERRHVDRRSQNHTDRHAREHQREHRETHRHDPETSSRRDYDTASAVHSKSRRDRHHESSSSSSKSRDHRSRRRPRSRSPRRAH